MFRKIERSLALQFTVFVFVLMLINGAMFLIADFGNQVREARQRLMTEMTRMREAVPDVLEGIGDLPFLPHPLQLRIVDVGGTTIVSDALFDDLTLQQEEGFSTSTINNRTFMLLTTVVTENDERIALCKSQSPKIWSSGTCLFALCCTFW
jgi:hypothetical protein